jgi:hypothetical protein
MAKENTMLNNGLSYRQVYPTKSNVDSTLLGQGGGGGNFYQGSSDGGSHDDESPEDDTEKEETAVFPPFNPQDIQVVTVEELIEEEPIEEK